MKPLLIVPMTGISSRFTAAGYDRPKFMLEVDGQLIIDHVIDMYPDWEDVIFICNGRHLDDPRLNLEEHLLTRRPRAQVVRLDVPQKGPGDAVLKVRDLIDRNRAVVVNYCDFTVYWDSDVLSERLCSGEVEGIIPCYTGFHPHMAFSTSYAYVKMEGGLVADIQEKKPWSDNPAKEFASSGTYAFATGAILLDALDEQVEKRYLLKGEYYLSLTFKPILERGGRVEVLNIEHFMQWGTPQDLEEYKDTSVALAAWNRPRVIDDCGTGADRISASRVILASGAGSRFAQAGYLVPKPLLPLSGLTVLEHAMSALPGKETVFVTRADLPGNDVVEALASASGAAIARLAGLSDGQASSALAGLRQLKTNGPVTVGACDALPTVSLSVFSAAVEAAGADGIIAWVAPTLHAAQRKPEQYGWVSAHGLGIDSVWIKCAPAVADAGVMIGTFTFPSVTSAILQIEALLSSGEQINGEFYLDSLIERALKSGRAAIALNVTTFVSVGTPTEYEAVRYWQSCLHKWALHPYSLATDPLVPTSARARLDLEFRHSSVDQERDSVSSKS